MDQTVRSTVYYVKNALVVALENDLFFLVTIKVGIQNKNEF